MPIKASLHDLVGDFIIYRDLDPADPRLPRFGDAWSAMGLAGPVRPRKLEPDYGQAVAWLLRRAQELNSPGTPLRELVYLGDTTLNDGNAFRHTRQAGGWRGWAFIGSERDEELAVAVREGLYHANRWSALAEFIAWLLADQQAALDAGTAVVVDIDKTALGARGRNETAIDRARLVAMEATVRAALEPAFDQEAFRLAHAELHGVRYHQFTADNQDNVAYLCLMVSGGVIGLAQLQADIASGRFGATADFMAWVEERRKDLPAPLQALHDDVYTSVQAGDPTPFKAFRRREYLETVRRMGQLPDDAPLGQRLLEEICLTREVLNVLRWLRGAGRLIFGLSDKPDEASFPPPEVTDGSLLPLHRVVTHVAGQAIAARLPEG